MDIVHAAMSDHNIMILGQAGTGKSFLINNLSKRLKEIGKPVYLTASTGMAAFQLHGMTIHKFSSIQDGRFPDNILIDKIKNNDDMIDIKRIMNVDNLFIDEISMLSLKLFLQIKKVLRTVKESNFPFGGIQIIVSGDFFQLKPVPNDVYHDRGELIISYEKIQSLIPHHYVLSQVHRQTEGAGGDSGSSESPDTFTIEYARSNKSKCRVCEETITRNQVRISKKDIDSVRAKMYGPQVAWHHVDCFVEKRDELGFGPEMNVETIKFFSVLKKEDRDMLIEKLGKGENPKKRKAEDKGDGGGKKQKNTKRTKE